MFWIKKIRRLCCHCYQETRPLLFLAFTATITYLQLRFKGCNYLSNNNMNSSNLWSICDCGGVFFVNNRVKFDVIK